MEIESFIDGHSRDLFCSGAIWMGPRAIELIIGLKAQKE